MNLVNSNNKYIKSRFRDHLNKQDVHVYRLYHSICLQYKCSKNLWEIKVQNKSDTASLFLNQNVDKVGMIILLIQSTGIKREAGRRETKTVKLYKKNFKIN